MTFVMRIIQAALTALVLQASQTIANLTRLHDGSHKAPVCISCDVLLDLQTFTKIPIQTLKKSIRRLECTYPLPAEVKEQYKRPPTESFRWLENALLSPRAVLYRNENGRNNCSYSCCRVCKNSLSQAGKAPPQFSVANGFAIGVPPTILLERKHVEIAMLSINRNMSHVFAYFGGQHKMIRGFHSFFKSDVTHTANTLQELRSITESSQIACILSGPFTSFQRNKVKEDVKIDIEKMQEALQWLHEHNRVYSSLDLNRQFPDPIVIDES